MKMKKILTIVSLAVFVACAAAYAQTDALPDNAPSVPPRGFNGVVYTPYGLSYDSADRAWTYKDKIVGLFSDNAAYGRIFLNPNGGVNVVALRDANNKLTGLREMTADEYQEALDAMDAMQIEIYNRMRSFRDIAPHSNDKIPQPTPVPGSPYSKRPTNQR
jgi:hypothetical protein